MTGTTDLIGLLEEIGQRDDGLGWAARGHARRFQRPTRYTRTREDQLHKLEGFAEVVEALGVLDRTTNERLNNLIIATWQEVWRIDREEGAQ